MLALVTNHASSTRVPFSPYDGGTILYTVPSALALNSNGWTAYGTLLQLPTDFQVTNLNGIYGGSAYLVVNPNTNGTSSTLGYDFAAAGTLTTANTGNIQGTVIKPYFTSGGVSITSLDSSTGSKNVDQAATGGTPCNSPPIAKRMSSASMGTPTPILTSKGIPSR